MMQGRRQVFETIKRCLFKGRCSVVRFDQSDSHNSGFHTAETRTETCGTICIFLWFRKSSPSESPHTSFHVIRSAADSSGCSVVGQHNIQDICSHFILAVFKYYLLNNKNINCQVQCTFFVHAELQKTFADMGKGQGRVWWSRLIHFERIL